MDTIRGYSFRSIVGTQAFYSNIEVRFPLIDYLALPFMQFANIRGNIFMDIGGAFYEDINPEGFRCYSSENSTLEDCVASYGWGVSFRLFGMDLNWDFARRWNFSETLSDGFETSFWIGPRF
jgi:outer membrane protein assembly factor BamA